MKLKVKKMKKKTRIIPNKNLIVKIEKPIYQIKRYFIQNDSTE